jgi:hypothetical protein
MVWHIPQQLPLSTIAPAGKPSEVRDSGKQHDPHQNKRLQGASSRAAPVRVKVEAFTVSKVPAPPLPPVPVPLPDASVSTFLTALPTLLGLVLNALFYHGYSSIKASFDANGSGYSEDDCCFITLR